MLAGQDPLLYAALCTARASHTWHLLTEETPCAVEKGHCAKFCEKVIFVEFWVGWCLGLDWSRFGCVCWCEVGRFDSRKERGVPFIYNTRQHNRAEAIVDLCSYFRSSSIVHASHVQHTLHTFVTTAPLWVTYVHYVLHIFVTTTPLWVSHMHRMLYFAQCVLACLYN